MAKINPFEFEEFARSQRDKQAQQSQTQEESPGWIDSAVSGFKSGASGVLGGLASVVHADDVANYFGNVAQENARKRETNGVIDYIFNPQGMWYDAWNQGGSIASLAPAAYLLPESAVGATVGVIGTKLLPLLGSAAGRWGASQVGKYALRQAAKKAGTEAAKMGALELGIRGAATSIPESLSEWGNVRTEAIEKGLDNPDLRGMKAGLQNLPLLAASNALEYMFLGGKLFEPSAEVGEGFAKRLAKMPFRAAPGTVANATQQAFEEGEQQGISDSALGEEASMLPWNWTPSQWEAAKTAFGGSMLIGGIGSGTRAMRVSNEKRKEWEEKNKQPEGGTPPLLPGILALPPGPSSFTNTNNTDDGGNPPPFGRATDDNAESMNAEGEPSLSTKSTENGEATYGGGEGSTWIKQTDDVSYEGAQPQTMQAIDLLSKWFYERTGRPLVVTAVTNGDSHESGDRSHYAGWKFDVNDWGSGAEGTLLGEGDGAKGTLTDEFIRYGQSLGLGMNWEGDHIDVSTLGDQWEGEHAGENFGGLNASAASAAQPAEGGSSVPSVQSPSNDNAPLINDWAYERYFQLGNEIKNGETDKAGDFDFFGGIVGEIEETGKLSDETRQELEDRFGDEISQYVSSKETNMQTTTQAQETPRTFQTGPAPQNEGPRIHMPPTSYLRVLRQMQSGQYNQDMTKSTPVSRLFPTGPNDANNKAAQQAQAVNNAVQAGQLNQDLTRNTVNDIVQQIAQQEMARQQAQMPQMLPLLPPGRSFGQQQNATPTQTGGQIAGSTADAIAQQAAPQVNFMNQPQDAGIQSIINNVLQGGIANAQNQSIIPASAPGNQAGGYTNQNAELEAGAPAGAANQQANEVNPFIISSFENRINAIESNFEQGNITAKEALAALRELSAEADRTLAGNDKKLVKNAISEAEQRIKAKADAQESAQQTKNEPRKETIAEEEKTAQNGPEEASGENALERYNRLVKEETERVKGMFPAGEKPTKNGQRTTFKALAIDNLRKNPEFSALEDEVNKYRAKTRETARQRIHEKLKNLSDDAIITAKEVGSGDPLPLQYIYDKIDKKILRDGGFVYEENGIEYADKEAIMIEGDFRRNTPTSKVTNEAREQSAQAQGTEKQNDFNGFLSSEEAKKVGNKSDIQSYLSKPTEIWDEKTQSHKKITMAEHIENFTKTPGAEFFVKMPDNNGLESNAGPQLVYQNDEMKKRNYAPTLNPIGFAYGRYLLRNQNEGQEKSAPVQGKEKEGISLKNSNENFMEDKSVTDSPNVQPYKERAEGVIEAWQAGELRRSEARDFLKEIMSGANRDRYEKGLTRDEMLAAQGFADDALRIINNDDVNRYKKNKDQKQEAAPEQPEDDFHGYLDGKSKMEQARIQRTLTQSKGNTFGDSAKGFMTSKKLMESLAKGNAKATEKNGKYFINGNRVTKTEYDYFNYLRENGFEKQETAPEASNVPTEEQAETVKGESNNGEEQEQGGGADGGHEVERSGESEADERSSAGEVSGRDGREGTRVHGSAGEENSGGSRSAGVRTGTELEEAAGNGTDAGRDQSDVSLTEAQAHPSPEETPGHDFEIKESAAGKTDEKIRFKQNIEAIRLLKKLEEENRMPTPAEQEVLGAYNGWGGLKKIFLDEKAKENKELRELLTDEEYNAAKSTMNDAFYTPPKIIRAIWEGVSRLGFKGGRILEPSLGIGNFFGCMPRDMMKHSDMRGIERDGLTSRIAKQLYPNAYVETKEFQKAKVADNYFDLVISNIPFGDKKVDGYHIHNYFFASGMDKVRPGGLMVFITSQGTLIGGEDAAKMRRYLDGKADMIAAYKLPSGTFSEAGTDVATDVVIFQKRGENGQKSKYAQPFIGVTEKTEQTGAYAWQKKKLYDINEYFEAHPENIIGDAKEGTDQYGNPALEVKKRKGETVDEGLAKAMQSLPENIYQPLKRGNKKPFDTTAANKRARADEKTRDLAYYERDGKIYQNQNGEEAPVTSKKAEVVKDYLGVKNALDTLYIAESDPKATDKQLDSLRKMLNKSYDTFVKKHGRLNNPVTAKNFIDDPSAGMVQALEKVKYEGTGKNRKIKKVEKADVFTQRTVQPVQEVKSADTPSDALLASLSNKGTVDLDYMADLLKTTKENVIGGLTGKIFQNPVTEEYETREEYLSGNVREKLAQAETAAKKNPAYQKNVEELKKVIPEDLVSSEILVNMGAPWIPVSDVQDFITSIQGYGELTAKFSPLLARWEVDGYGGNPKYEAKGIRLSEMLEAILNNKAIEIYTGPKKDQVLDKEATDAANVTADELRNDFNEWLWSDKEREDRLVRYYNDNYNNTVNREYDGSHLNPNAHGMNSKITLKPHQKNVVWRMLQKGNTLIAHCVGAGKTFEMQTAGMEMRRLGIANKPMYCLPNNVVEQFAREFRQLYPEAKLLVLQTKDLPAVPKTMEKTKTPDGRTVTTEKKLSAKDKERVIKARAERNRTLARVRTEDWDGIIISHDLFQRFPLSPETAADFIREQIDILERTIQEAHDNKMNTRTMASLENKKAALQDRLEDILNTNLDDIGIPFEALGIDQLFVDEADMFKNLHFATSMDRVSGLTNSDANRSNDMFAKTQWLTKAMGGRGVVFATGTPVSNTMAELYTMTRYLDMQGLKEKGLELFDNWIRTFSEIGSGIERRPDGNGYRKVNKVKRFINMAELNKMFRKFADVKTQDDLDLDIPKLKNDKATIVKLDADPEITRYIKEEVPKRVAKMKHAKKGEKGSDNMLALTGDLRKMSLNDDKIEACAEQIAKKYEETTDVKGTQLVFCDIGIPKAQKDAATDADAETFDGGEETENEGAYEKLIAALKRRGIPSKQIAFVQSAKNKEEMDALFQKVNEGDVRILIGSTQKMGAGTNCQKHLVALHDLDAPWRPRDLEQRHGRILRQGNDNKQVEIFNYVVQDSFDANMWEKLKNKAAIIAQAMSSDTTIRAVEDADLVTLSYAEVEGAATGNPLIKERLNLNNEVTKYAHAQTAFKRRQRDAENTVTTHPDMIEEQKEIIGKIKDDIAARKDVSGDKFRMTISGKTYTERAKADEKLKSIFDVYKKGVATSVGEIGGFKLSVYYDGIKPILQLVRNRAYPVQTPTAMGIQNALQNAPDYALSNHEGTLELYEHQLSDAQGTLKQENPYEEKLKEMTKRLAEIDREIEKSMTEEGSTPQAETATDSAPMQTAETAAPVQKAEQNKGGESASETQTAEEFFKDHVIVGGVPEHFGSTASQESNFTTGDFKHTKTGEMIPQAKLKEQIDNYKEISAIAKRHGGYYSRYSKSFLFKSEKDRDAFVREADTRLSGTKYSTSGEMTEAERMRNEARELSRDEWTPKQKKIAEFGEQMGVPVVFIEADPRLHGYHEDGVTYLNINSEVPIQNVFWHESFHWMRNNNPELYADMMERMQEIGVFPEEDIADYKKSIGRPELTNEEAIEEMLADAMMDAERRGDIMQNIARADKGLIERFVAWLRETMDAFQSFMKNPDAGLTRAKIAAMNNELARFLRRVEDGNGNRIFSVTPKGEVRRYDGRALPAVAYSAKMSAKWDEGLAGNQDDRENQNNRKLETVSRKYADIPYRAQEYIQRVTSSDSFARLVRSSEDIGAVCDRAVQNLKGAAEAQISNYLEATNPVQQQRSLDLAAFYVGMVDEIRRDFSEGGQTYKIIAGCRAVRESATAGSNLARSLRDGRRANQGANDKGTAAVDGYSPKAAPIVAKIREQDRGDGIKFSVNLGNKGRSGNQGGLSDARKSVGNSFGKIIRNKLAGIVGDGTARIRKEMKDALESAAGMKIRSGHIGNGHNSMARTENGIIVSRYDYDWDVILPEAGKAIAKRLGLSSSEEMGEYIGKFLLDGALSESNTKMAMEFQKAMRKNPEVQYAVLDAQEAFQKWNSMEASERIKASVQWTKRGAIEKILMGETDAKDEIAKAWNVIKDQFVEEFLPMERQEKAIEAKTGKKISAKDSAYRAFRMLRGNAGMAMNLIEGKNKDALKLFNMKYSSANMKNTLTMILDHAGILHDAKGQEEFGTYCIAKDMLDVIARNQRLERQIGDMEDMYDAIEAELKNTKDEEKRKELKEQLKEISEKHAKLRDEVMPVPHEMEEYLDTVHKDKKRFDKAQQEIVDYSRALSAMLVDSGVISKKRYDEMQKAFPNYVPLFRVFDENEEIYFGDSLKHAHGSTKDIINPFESIMSNTFKFVRLAGKNEAKLKLANLAKMSDVGDIIRVVDDAKPNDRTLVPYMENGQKRYIQTDPTIVTAINSMGEQYTNLFFKVLTFPSKIARATFTTANPSFALRNIFRDAADAYLYGKHVKYNPWGFITDLYQGLMSAIHQDELFYEWMASGAAQASIVSTDRDYMQSTIDKITLTWKDKIKRPWKWPGAILDMLQMASEYSEYATRIAVYKRTKNEILKNNATISAMDAMTEAAFESRDLMDFARGGKAGRSMNQLFLFSNASIQGWDKFFRTMRFDEWAEAFAKRDPSLVSKEAKVAMVKLALTSILPTIFLFMLNHDKDWWKEIPDWQKEKHWLIKMGDTILRIPKGMDPGIQFTSNFVEMGLGKMYDNDPIKFNRLIRPLVDTMPEILPTTFMPFLETYANYSFFLDRNIVPQYQTKLPEKMQYGPHTSAFAKWMGEKFGFSPRKIDHLIAGYGGNIGKTIADLPNVGKNTLDRSLEEMPVISGLLATPFKNPKSVQDFYEKFDEQEKLYNEFKMTRVRPDGFDPVLYGRMKKARTSLQKLSKMERSLMNNPNVSLDDRKARQEQIQARRVEIIKRVMGR